MLDPANSPDSHNAISSQESEFGHMPCVNRDGPIAALFGQALARANLSARQAKEMGFLTSGTYGLHGSTSLPNAPLTLSLANKLQAMTDWAGSTLFKLTWKQRVTPGGAVDLCAAGVGAPHIRQRLWFVADTPGNRRIRESPSAAIQTGRTTRPEQSGQLAGRLKGCAIPDNGQAAGMGVVGVADSDQHGLQGRTEQALFGERGRQEGHEIGCSRSSLDERGASPTNSLWRNADWLLCRDGKWRPVEPGTFPLADGATARMGRLRAYGNAINAKAAEAVIRAYMECRP